jgi:hypothetical protein
MVVTVPLVVTFWSSGSPVLRQEAKETTVTGPSLLSSLSSPEQRLLYQAQQLLIASCMRNHGFRYWAVPWGSLQPTNEPLPYLLPSASWARLHGFGVDQGPDPNAAYVSRLLAARLTSYQAALFGFDTASAQVTVTIPQGGVVGHSTAGCQASAEAELYGNFRSWFRASTIVSNLIAWLHAQIADSPIYQRHLRSWITCAKAAGYDWSSPLAAAVIFQSREAAQPSAQEIRAAVQSATCAASSRLIAIASEIGTSRAAIVEVRYGSEVNAYRQLEERALRVARTVLAQHV